MNQSSRHSAAIDDLPWAITQEFEEQPGLRLTFLQIRQLWNLSAEDCQNVLEYLVSSGGLVFDADDRYCRPEDPDTRPAPFAPWMR